MMIVARPRLHVPSALAAAALVAVACPPLSAEATEPSATAVAEKVRLTMEAALTDAPLVALQRSRLGSEAAAMRSDTGAGPMALSWQSEGIGGGFDRDPNAADYLRLSLPFNRPWDIGTNRRLRQATDRWLERGQTVAAVEVSALAGRSWLQLAAATAHQALAETRYGRLERAVTLQRKRFELGEISGSERRQVELQLAREAANLKQAEAVRLAVQRELEVLAPSGFPQPGSDDLAVLAGATVPSGGAPNPSRLETGPVLQFASSRTEVAQLRAVRQRGTAYGLPHVEVEWERIPDVAGVEGFDSFGFSLAVPLPFGRQGRERVRVSELSSLAAAAEQDLTLQQVEARFQTALETMKGAQDALAALAPSLAEVEATESSLTAQFHLGAISYLVYLDGLSRLDEVIRSAIETRLVLLVARLELAELTGTEEYFPLPKLKSEVEP